jgi:hypothetical protein
MPQTTTTAGEGRILAEAPSGKVIDLLDLSDEERVVSADVIRQLCIGQAAKAVDPRGVWIRGAHVDEPLDLSFCTVPHPLRFELSTFDEPVNLIGAEFPRLWFASCALGGLQADGARIENDLRLISSRMHGEARLAHANIGTQLACSGAELAGENDVALMADSLEVGGTAFFNDLAATGTVRLLGARIGGQLEFNNATLSCEGSDGDALDAEAAEIALGVLVMGSWVTGRVSFKRARIGGQLDCSSTTLMNEDGVALDADEVVIGSLASLGNGFRAVGEINLRGAKIAGQLQCSAATLRCPKDGSPFNADGIDVGHDFVCEGSRTTGGEVRLLGAKIGGQFNCSGAAFANEGGVALGADRVEVGGGVFLIGGFNATGEVRFPRSKIGSQLVCAHASLANDVGVALMARDAAITDELIIGDVQIDGGVDLSGARAAILDDDLGRRADPLGSWAGVRPLILEDFAYARFDNRANWDAGLRRNWIQQTAGFQPAAWQQLIEVYRAQGRDEEATGTAIAMHNDRMARAGLPWHRLAGRYVLRAVVGHGYKSWRALIWGAAIVTAFALVVWNWSEMFVPAGEGVAGSPQPVAYSIDTFLPFISLGQADDWVPTGWVRWVTWSVILLGWSLSTLFVAGFTRIVRSV